MNGSQPAGNFDVNRTGRGQGKNARSVKGRGSTSVNNRREGSYLMFREFRKFCKVQGFCSVLCADVWNFVGKHSEPVL